MPFPTGLGPQCCGSEEPRLGETACLHDWLRRFNCSPRGSPATHLEGFSREVESLLLTVAETVRESPKTRPRRFLSPTPADRGTPSEATTTIYLAREEPDSHMYERSPTERRCRPTRV